MFLCSLFNVHLPTLWRYYLGFFYKKRPYWCSIDEINLGRLFWKSEKWTFINVQFSKVGILCSKQKYL